MRRILLSGVAAVVLPGMALALGAHWSADPVHFRERIVVDPRQRFAFGDEAVQPSKLDTCDSGLQIRHPVIEA